jgi:hypothetical protein
VLVATQNGPNIASPIYSNGQQVGVNQVPSWTPPPVNPQGTGNNQLRQYNSIGPRAGNDLGYLFVNGVDFGLEINY